MKIFTLIAVLIMTSFPALAIDSADTKKSLDSFNNKFNKVVIDKDIEGLLNLYAEDTLWISSDAPAVIGLTEPRALFEFVFAQGGSVSHSIDSLFIADDSSQAVMIGTAFISMGENKLTGTYLFVLKPFGDSWKIATDMWHQHKTKKAQ